MSYPPKRKRSTCTKSKVWRNVWIETFGSRCFAKTLFDDISSHSKVFKRSSFFFLNIYQSTVQGPPIFLGIAGNIIGAILRDPKICFRGGKKNHPVFSRGWRSESRVARAPSSSSRGWGGRRGVGGRRSTAKRVYIRTCVCHWPRSRFRCRRGARARARPSRSHAAHAHRPGTVARVAVNPRGGDLAKSRISLLARQ